MEIIYSLEKQDVINARWYFSQVKPGSSTRRIRQFTLLFVATIGIINIFFVWSQYDWLVRLLSFLIFLGFYWILSKILSWLINLYLVRQNIPKTGLVCQHTITLTENQLKEITDVNQSYHNWEGINKIEENQDYLFIFTTLDQFHIIPKRVFASSDEYQKFYAFAKKCYDQFHAATSNQSPINK